MSAEDARQSMLRIAENEEVLTEDEREALRKFIDFALAIKEPMKTNKEETFEEWSKQWVEVSYGTIRVSLARKAWLHQKTKYEALLKEKDKIIEYLESNIEFCKCGNPRADCICYDSN